jgi:DNA-binding transcriptional LysR family regulator
MHALVPPDFPLLGKVEAVTLKDLQPYPVALTHKTYGTRQVVEAAMMMEKLRITPTITTNSMVLLKHFVMSGLGVTLLPPFAARNEIMNGDLYSIPINNPLLLSSEAHIITRVGRKLSTAANKLMQHLGNRMKVFQEE